MTAINPILPRGQRMPADFDVFLSHNSRDKPQVEQIAMRLHDRGLRAWLDKWELRPGFPWQEGLEGGIQAARAVAVFVGANGLGAWQEPEMRAFIARSRREKVPVIPVLLPGCPDSPQLTLFLEAFTWVDLRHRLTDEGLARLAWGITGAKPDVHTNRPETLRWWWSSRARLAYISATLVLALAVGLWLRSPVVPLPAEVHSSRPDNAHSARPPGQRVRDPANSAMVELKISTAKTQFRRRTFCQVEHEASPGSSANLCPGKTPETSIVISLMSCCRLH